MIDNLLKSQAFKLKGRLYTLTVLHVLTTDKQQFAEQLADVLAKAPKLFEHAPLVLDFSALSGEHVDIVELTSQLRQTGLMPVAIQGVSADQQMQAIGLGLAPIHASSSQDKLFAEVQPEPTITPAETIRTKLLTTPVRSGQQVVSKGGDLVVTSSVSQGAELLADGNIHVYGALRGRALAGIDGNKQARIFCHALEAELVSIAGFYRLSDSMQAPQGPCQIFLQDEHIHIEPL